MKKLISTVTAFTFILNLAVSSVGAGASLADSKADYSINDNFIVNEYKTQSADTVFLVQDLHCHYDTQQKIADLIDNITNRIDFNKLFVEGATQNFEDTFIKKLPESIKNPFAQSLLKQGKIGGAEYFFLTSDKKVPVYALEDAAVYAGNAIRLDYILSSQEEVSKIITEMEKSLKVLQRKSLDNSSKKLLSQIDKYQNNETNQEAYYKFLLKQAEKSGINLNGYPSIQKLASVSRRISYKKVNKELNAYMEAAKAALPYSAYKELAENKDVLSNISQINAKFNTDMGKYPELANYLAYYECVSSLSPLELYSEEKNLFNAVLINNANEINVEIVILSLAFKKLKAFMANKATDSDFNYIKDFNTAFFEFLWDKYFGQQTFAQLKPYIEVYESYYKANELRNTIFAEKIASRLKQKDGKNISIAVTGGFHTNEIRKMLNDKGVSVVVLTPKVNGGIPEAEEKYTALFNEQVQSGVKEAFINGYALKMYVDTGDKALLIKSLSEICGMQKAGQFGGGSLESIIGEIVNKYNELYAEKISIENLNSAETAFSAVLKTAKGGKTINVGKNGEININGLNINAKPPTAAIFSKLWDKVKNKKQLTFKERVIDFIANPYNAPLWETGYIAVLTAILGPAAAGCVFLISHFVADFALDAKPKEFLKEARESKFSKYVKLILPAVIFTAPFIAPISILGATGISWILHSSYNALAVEFGWEVASMIGIRPEIVKIYRYEPDNNIRWDSEAPAIIEKNLLGKHSGLVRDEYRDEYVWGMYEGKTLLVTKFNKYGRLGIIGFDEVLPKEPRFAGREVRVIMSEHGIIMEIYIMSKDGLTVDMKRVFTDQEKIHKDENEAITGIAGEIYNDEKEITDIDKSVQLYPYKTDKNGIPLYDERDRLENYPGIVKDYDAKHNNEKLLAVTSLDENGTISLLDKTIDTKSTSLAYFAWHTVIAVVENRKIIEAYIMSKDGKKIARKYVPGILNGFPDSFMVEERAKMPEVIVVDGEFGDTGNSIYDDFENKDEYVKNITGNEESGQIRIYKYDLSSKDFPLIGDSDNLLGKHSELSGEDYRDEYVAGAGEGKKILVTYLDGFGNADVFGNSVIATNDKKFAGRQARVVLDEQGNITEAYIMSEDFKRVEKKYITINTETDVIPVMKEVAKISLNKKNKDHDVTTKSKADKYIRVYRYDANAKGIPLISRENFLGVHRYKLSRKNYDMSYSQYEGKKIVQTTVNAYGNISLFGKVLTQTHNNNFADKEVNIVLNSDGLIEEFFIMADNESVKYVNANIENPQEPNMQKYDENPDNFIRVYSYSAGEGGMPLRKKENLLAYYANLSRKEYDAKYSGRKTVIETMTDVNSALNILGEAGLFTVSGAKGKIKTLSVVDEKGIIREAFVLLDSGIIKYVNADKENPEMPNMQPGLDSIENPTLIYPYKTDESGMLIFPDDEKKALNYYTRLSKKVYSKKYLGKKIIIVTKTDNYGILSVLGVHAITTKRKDLGNLKTVIVMDKSGNIEEAYILSKSGAVKYVNADKKHPEKNILRLYTKAHSEIFQIFPYKHENGVPVYKKEERIAYFNKMDRYKRNNLSYGEKKLYVTGFDNNGTLNAFSQPGLIVLSEKYAGAEARIVVDEKENILEIYVMADGGYLRYENANIEDLSKPNMQRDTNNFKETIEIYRYKVNENGIPVCKTSNKVNYYNNILKKSEYAKRYVGRKMTISGKLNSTGSFSVLQSGGKHMIQTHDSNLAGTEVRVVINEKAEVVVAYLIFDNSNTKKYRNINKENPSDAKMSDKAALPPYAKLEDFYQISERRYAKATAREYYDWGMDEEQNVVIANLGNGIPQVITITGQFDIYAYNNTDGNSYKYRTSPYESKAAAQIAIYRYDITSVDYPVICEDNFMGGHEELSIEKYMREYVGGMTEGKKVLVAKTDIYGNLNVFDNQIIKTNDSVFANKEARTIIDENGKITTAYIMSKDGKSAEKKYININVYGLTPVMKEADKMPTATILGKLWDKVKNKEQLTFKERVLDFIANPYKAPVWETGYIAVLTAILGAAPAAYVFLISHFIADFFLDAKPGEFLKETQKNKFSKYVKLILPTAAFAAPFIAPVSILGAMAISWMLHSAYNVLAEKYGWQAAAIAGRKAKQMYVRVYRYDESSSGVPGIDEGNFLGAHKQLGRTEYADEYAGGKEEGKKVLVKYCTKAATLNIIGHNNILQLNKKEFNGRETRTVVDENINIVAIYVMSQDGKTFERKYVNADTEDSGNANIQRQISELKNPVKIYEYKENKQGVPVYESEKILNYYEKYTKDVYGNRYSGRKILVVKKLNESAELSFADEGNLIKTGNSALAGNEARIVMNDKGHITKVFIMDKDGKAVAEEYANVDTEHPENPNMQKDIGRLPNPIKIYRYTADENGIPVYAPGEILNYYGYMQRNEYAARYVNIEHKRKNLLVVNSDNSGDFQFFNEQVQITGKALANREVRIVINENGYVEEAHIMSDDKKTAELVLINADNGRADNMNMQRPLSELDNPVKVYDYAVNSQNIPVYKEDEIQNYYNQLGKDDYDRRYGKEKRKIILIRKADINGNISFLGDYAAIHTGRLDLAGNEGRAVINEQGVVTEAYVMSKDGAEVILKYVNLNRNDGSKEPEIIREKKFIYQYFKNFYEKYFTEDIEKNLYYQKMIEAVIDNDDDTLLLALAAYDFSAVEKALAGKEKMQVKDIVRNLSAAEGISQELKEFFSGLAGSEKEIAILSEADKKLIAAHSKQITVKMMDKHLNRMIKQNESVLNLILLDDKEILAKYLIRNYKKAKSRNEYINIFMAYMRVQENLSGNEKDKILKTVEAGLNISEFYDMQKQLLLEDSAIQHKMILVINMYFNDLFDFKKLGSDNISGNKPRIEYSVSILSCA